MPSRSEFALVAVSVYALALTLRHAQLSGPLNSLCTRDFVEPAASGTCLCGEKEFCLCTPSLAADVIIELEDSVGTVRHVESSLNARTVGRGLAMVGGFVKVGESRFLLGDTGRR